ncbi:hypothetical protein [Pseudobutyrivibrio sp. ACV-2]|uniref:hypothetical protein n=1 Tax=Pseudobutyrivibrio sp. ACV-2 TaxID=1520801 RepID=UPI001481039D|nr:hypothetical protein [Pseudobutyrivibrio sp. ACV-2]
MLMALKLYSVPFWFMLFYVIGHFMLGDFVFLFVMVPFQSVVIAVVFWVDLLILPLLYVAFPLSWDFFVSVLVVFAMVIGMFPGIVLLLLANGVFVVYVGWRLISFLLMYKVVILLLVIGVGRLFISILLLLWLLC